MVNPEESVSQLVHFLFVQNSLRLPKGLVYERINIRSIVCCINQTVSRQENKLERLILL